MIPYIQSLAAEITKTEDLDEILDLCYEIEGILYDLEEAEEASRPPRTPPKLRIIGENEKF